MTKARRIGLFWLILCCGFSVLWSVFLDRGSPNGALDFEGIYYDAQCLLQHSDPYKVGEPLRVYLAENGKIPQSADGLRKVLAVDVYPPTSSIFIVPFTLLPSGIARLLWTILSAASLILSAFLVWDATADFAPLLSGCLICFVLANSEVVFGTGNSAGIVVSLCIVAVWCFLNGKFPWAGILLAVSLAIKPHDAGLVWLYFLLAGGIYRKRALQTLFVTAVLGLAAILWITPIAPHWLPELRSNILAAQLPGGLNDPSPTSVTGVTPGMVIGLQSAISVFRGNPRFYNPASYVVCGSLLLVWSVRTLRARFSPASAWLALAAVVPLTLLVTYHRPYDAKLLLLDVPACAMLWAERGPLRWIALLVTIAGIVSTSDIPLTIFLILTKNLHISTVELSGKILAVLMRPTALILLVMGMFYLWVYLWHDPDRVVTADTGTPKKTLLAPWTA